MRTEMMAALLGLGACGTTPDERPATLEVIALEVLAPSCGQVQCHSSTSNLEGYAFDTFEGARASLRELVSTDGDESELLEVLTADGGDRMPPDSPLASEDIALVRAWIDGGAEGL